MARSLTHTLVLLLSLSLTACLEPPIFDDDDASDDDSVPDTEGNCTDGVDNDDDGNVDCADTDCSGKPACQEQGHCQDGIDNDLDGATDCADEDCDQAPACQAPLEDCNNGLDDDGDALVDCDDPDCFQEPVCMVENCQDGLDNDGDGAIDCADTDCAFNLACVCDLVPELLCGASMMASTLGLPSVAPGNCLGTVTPGGEYGFSFVSSVEQSVIVTVDDIDPSADLSLSVIDGPCGSWACIDGSDLPGNQVEQVAFGTLSGIAEYSFIVDSHGAGGSFRISIDCLPSPTGEGNCSDGIDNDGDLRVDCYDSDCEGTADCIFATEAYCDNGLDDDADGAVDCEDSECMWSPACDLTCPLVLDLQCGTEIIGNTVGGTVNWDTYSQPCDAFPEAGPERVYFLDPLPETLYRFRLSGLDPLGDLDLLFLDVECDPDQCSGATALGPGLDEELIVFPQAAGGLSNLVVESYSPQGSPFVLTTDCFPAEMNGEQSCFDGIDNDFDNLVDCADPDCASVPGC